MDKYDFLKNKAASSIETLTLLELMKDDRSLTPEQVIREHRDTIRSTIRGLARRYADVLDPEDLEDVEQEVYLRIIRGCLAGYRGDISLKNYIAGYIVRSAFHDFLRKNLTSRKEATEDISLVSDIVQLKSGFSDPTARGLEGREMVIIIEEEVASMTDTRREIFRLIVDERMTQAEAGEVLGLGQSTVSEHFSKIVSQLRSALRKKFPEHTPQAGGR
ncbi:MAG TPA: sigma-70 family RNA polymerase sigma factor [Spirochaetota bacterium]|nr:sigma-70 family RNA polymerase sigma factor [Spirochaetota bacterium]